MLAEDRTIDGTSFLGQMLNEADAPARDWVFAGYGARAFARSQSHLLNEQGVLFDVSEDRYRPTALRQQVYRETDRQAYTMLKAAMESLDHPYTGEVKRRRPKAKRRN